MTQQIFTIYDATKTIEIHKSCMLIDIVNFLKKRGSDLKYYKIVIKEPESKFTYSKDSICNFY